MHIAAVGHAFPDHYYDQDDLLKAFMAFWGKRHFNLDRLARPDPSISGRMPLVIEALGQLRHRVGDDLSTIGMVVAPFLVACELRGMTNLLLDLLTDPPYLEALLEHVTEAPGAMWKPWWRAARSIR